jgi:haloalkane dehalogenase
LYYEGEKPMERRSISPIDSYTRERISVLDSEMAYVDTGKGDPVVFLHGNPTSSYLWRNIIPHVEGLARCLAPDLIGMGDSGKAPKGSYRFVDHVRYLDAWFEALGLDRDITLVGHDWGAALGFYWAFRHPDRIKGIVYMETFVKPLEWDQWPEAARIFFENLRSPAGEEMILQNNEFVERHLPRRILRALSEDEMAVYRRPYKNPGESRRPILTWPREVPLGEEPADVVKIVNRYGNWLTKTDLPKLFINAEPGSILTGKQREFCRSWPKQQEVTVKGLHFIQEDSPAEIGEAIAGFVKGIIDTS